MSFEYPENIPARKKIHSFENRKRKNSRIFIFMILACITGIACLISGSGIWQDQNPQIPQKMLARINLERTANNLPVIQWNDNLASDATTASREIMVSRSPSAGLTDSSPLRENVFVIPKIDWLFASFDSQGQLLDALENADPSFREYILNPEYHSVGIGLASDMYNYHIVTCWE